MPSAIIDGIIMRQDVIRQIGPLEMVSRNRGAQIDGVQYLNTVPVYFRSVDKAALVEPPNQQARSHMRENGQPKYKLLGQSF
jgi:hypothetical protein